MNNESRPLLVLAQRVVGGADNKVSTREWELELDGIFDDIRRKMEAAAEAVAEEILDIACNEPLKIWFSFVNIEKTKVVIPLGENDWDGPEWEFSLRDVVLDAVDDGELERLRKLKLFFISLLGDLDEGIKKLEAEQDLWLKDEAGEARHE